MTKKVRVRCGRCRTVNVAVTDESVDPDAAGAAEREQRVAVAQVGRGAVAVEGRDPDDRRMPIAGVARSSSASW